MSKHLLYCLKVNVEELLCEMHHCGHPNQDEGSHTHPPADNNIYLVETDQTRAYHVPYSKNVIYQCEENYFIENNELDPTKNNIKVQCMANEGIYNIPESWPNCTKTVDCGPPPAMPVGGSITWLNGTKKEVGLFNI